jgi:hypothetical protein
VSEIREITYARHRKLDIRNRDNVRTIFPTFGLRKLNILFWKPWDPAWNLHEIFLIPPAKLSLQRWLLIKFDKQIDGQENDCQVTQQPKKFEPQKVSKQKKEYTYIHWISDVAIEAHDHKLFWRIERRGRAPSFVEKIPEAPKKNNSADRPKRECEISQETRLNLRSLAE